MLRLPLDTAPFIEGGAPRESNFSTGRRHVTSSDVTECCCRGGRGRAAKMEEEAGGRRGARRAAPGGPQVRGYPGGHGGDTGTPHRAGDPRWGEIRGVRGPSVQRGVGGGAAIPVVPVRFGAGGFCVMGVGFAVRVGGAG